MDYRLNNEAIVACVIAQLVRNGRRRLPVVVGLTNLLMHEKERKKVLSSNNVQELTAIVGQLDGGLLAIIMNSIVMMIKGGCMTFGEDVLCLTPSGMNLCEQMRDGRSKILRNIIADMPSIMRKMEETILASV